MLVVAIGNAIAVCNYLTCFDAKSVQCSFLLIHGGRLSCARCLVMPRIPLCCALMRMNALNTSATI